MQVTQLPRGIYLLLLLYANEGEPIVNRTRLEKLVFLITKEVLTKSGRRITSKEYTFRADRFGPFTEEVYDDVHNLQNLRLVEWDENQEILKISARGNELVGKILGKNLVPYDLLQDIRRIKTMYNKASLKSLLRYVYQNYEKYTYESDIRDEILG